MQRLCLTAQAIGKNRSSLPQHDSLFSVARPFSPLRTNVHHLSHHIHPAPLPQFQHQDFLRNSLTMDFDIDTDNSPPALAILPEELLLAIIERLTIPSLVALSQVNRKFQRIARPILCAKRFSFLLNAQSFSLEEGQRFACFICCKTYFSDSFSVNQTRGRRAIDGDKELWRFCADC